MNSKVSIIVPIYNVGKYLGKCIESIINQTYSNIEVILVNDESKDNSLEICNEYALRDKRIKVIDKVNGGVATARNAGIDASTGDYFCLVDGDDYISKYYVEKMLSRIIEDKTDLVQCCALKVDDAGNNLGILGYSKDCILTGYQMSLEAHLVQNIVIWNRLYKKSILKELRFPNGKCGEDNYFSYQMFYRCKNISIMKDELYFYRQNMTGYTRSKFSYKKLDGLEITRDKIKFYEEKNESELVNYAIINLLDMSIGYYCKVYNEISKTDPYLKIIYDDFVLYLKRHAKYSLKKKIRYFIFKHFPRCYAKFIRR